MNTLKSQIQTEVSEILKSGISQNKLAEQIGISAATLISVRRGEWENISESMLQKLRGHLRINDWKIYETTNLKAITELCRDASENKKFMGLAGFTGAGKSTALRKYATKNPNTWYILGTTIMTQRTFLTAILRSMGISEGQAIQDKMSIIIREMNNNTDSLLIIDDAGKLTDNILRLIQIIYDETEDNAGIIIAGTELLYEYISKGAITGKRGFRELMRRVAYWQPVYKPAKSEVAYICNEYGIKDARAVSYIQSQSNFGDIKNLITNAILMHTRTGRAIDREMLEDLKVGNHFYKYQTH